MFSFDLPMYAAMKVQLPTGGDAMMIHLGAGRFVSNVPPLVLVAVTADPGQGIKDVALTWDSKCLPADVHHTTFGFDLVGAQRSLEAAAAAGDELAREVMSKLTAAEAMLEADEARVEHEAAGAAKPDRASAVRAEAVKAGVTDERMINGLVAMTQTDDLRGMPAPADSRDSL